MRPKLSEKSSIWIWRAGVLACLAVIAWELHEIRREMPEGIDYQTARELESIDQNTKDAAEQLRMLRLR